MNKPSNTSRVHTLNVYLIFTISGLSALIYQIIWARWLGLVFGNTATSVSIVLASFMLGLALGSYLVGRRLHKIENPMLMYAYLELGIGLFAVCFPWFSMFTDGIFTSIVNAETPLSWSIAVRGILAFILLAIPTTLMGATLPLLTDFFRRDPRHTNTWKVGLLYAANTFGAAVGIMVASFILIELIGVRSTTLFAAALNFFVAYIALKYAHSTVLQPAGSVSEQKLPLDKMGKLALVVLAASGAIALASEVLWTRALEILIGNSTYAFAMIVIVYLLGIATGSWAMSLIVNRLKSLSLWLAGIQLGMGIWTILAIVLFSVVSPMISQHTNMIHSIGEIFLYHLQAVFLLFPLAFLSGANFPLATRIIAPHTEDADGVLIAQAYAWNTIGAVFGALIAGFGIAAFLDYFQAIYLLGVFYGITALMVVFVSIGKNVQRQYAMVVMGILSCAVIGLSVIQTTENNRFVERVKQYHPGYDVLYHKPGLQGVTTVLQPPNMPRYVRLLVNGAGMTNKATDTKMMAHLPMLVHPNPENTLVICFGMGTTYRSAMSYGQKVTVVELVNEVLGAFDHFYSDAQRIRDYPNGQMINNDGRNFLKLTEERFDVITIDPPPPIDSAGVNHLYSKDFIELARSRLKKGGIMAHWIPFPKQGGGVHDWTTFNMLLGSFATVYPHTLMIPGWNKVGMHVLGSMEPLEVSDTRLRKSFMTKGIAQDITEWDLVPLSYFQQFMPIDSELWKGFPFVTDDRPLLEFNMLRYWKTDTQIMLRPVFW